MASRRRRLPTPKTREDRFRFGRETIAELRKAVWPSRSETTNLTIIVIIVSAVVGLMLGGVDWVFASIIELLLH